MLPKVILKETDNSVISETFTGEIGAYIGMFEKGVINEPIYITSTEQFKTIFGRGIGVYKNHWYQVYNYLQYSSGIYVTRCVGLDTFNAVSNTKAIKTQLKIGDYILSGEEHLTDYSGVVTNDLINLDGSKIDFEKYPTLYDFLGSSTLETLLAPENSPYGFYKVIADYTGVNKVTDVTRSYTNYQTISNKYEFLEKWDEFSTDNGVLFMANSAGESGNLLDVYVVDVLDYDNNINVFGGDCQNLFSYFNDGYIGIVVARDSIIKEIFYITLEKLNSNNSDVRSIPFNSQYIYSKFDNFKMENKGLFNISNGVTTIPTIENYQESHDIFLNKELYVIDNFIANQEVPNQAISLAEIRRDMIVFVGLPIGVLEYLAYIDELGNSRILYSNSGEVMIYSIEPLKGIYTLSTAKEFIASLKPSKYAVVTNNIKQQIDGYTGKTILLNIAGDLAGLKSQTSLKNLYMPGSGLVNGQIKNMLKSHVKWTNKELNEMYDLNCNYVLDNVMKSQRTFIEESNPYSRVNIRSLFNHIERQIEYTQIRSVFEFADTHTLNKIKSECVKILEDAKSSRGVVDYYITVYANLNNEKIVDPRRINIEVYIKPSYIAEYVVLRVYNNGKSDT